MAEGDNMNEENTNIQEVEAGSAEITYSQADFDKKLQAESDRRVEMALQKERKKFQSQMAEAEKLRTMNEEQKATYEYEQRVKALEEKEREFALRENKIEASRILQEKGLPTAMIEYMKLEDAENMLDTINSFELMFQAAVNDAVSKRVATPSPRTGSVSQTGMSKESFKKMSLPEQMDLYRTNPKLYMELAKK